MTLPHPYCAEKVPHSRHLIVMPIIYGDPVQTVTTTVTCEGRNKNDINSWIDHSQYQSDDVVNFEGNIYRCTGETFLGDPPSSGYGFGRDMNDGWELIEPDTYTASHTYGPDDSPLDW